jgi:hypothetical protein
MRMGLITCLVPSASPINIVYEVLIYYMRAKCNTRIIFLDLIPLIFYMKNNSANCEAPHYAIFTIHQLLSLMTNYFPQHLVLEYL